MTAVSDDRSAAEAALQRAFEQAADDDAAQRPLAGVLADVARSVVGILSCRSASIVIRAADGREALSASAGDGAATGSATFTVPLLLRGRAAGELLLTGPAVGAAFGEQDSSIAHSAALGIAALVERARTVDANRRRERWLSGGTEIARALTGGGHGDPLTLIAEHATEIADVDTVAVLAAGSAPGLILVEAATGVSAGQVGRQVPDTDEGHVQRVLDSGRAVRIDDLAATTSRTDLPIDAVMLAPMHGSAGLRGVLAFGRAGRGTFSEAELSTASMFAGTVALALELAESQNRREQRALVAERERIARDLHDHVIQRLYAIGLTIQYVTSLVGGEPADRLLAGITDIDAAIAQIRSTIFRLSLPILGADLSLRARAEALMDELEPVLGYRPTLVSEGPLDFGLDDDLVADCEAVLREGITNIARHAHASSANVLIAVTRSDVRIVIADDGRGLGATDRRSGLANLRRRAEQHGGSLEIETGPTSGTRLTWTVPLG